MAIGSRPLTDFTYKYHPDIVVVVAVVAATVYHSHCMVYISNMAPSSLSQNDITLYPV